MEERLLGGYTKSANIRKVINRLTNIGHDTPETIKIKRAEVNLLVELEIINEEQAKVLTDIFKRVG